MVRVFSTFAASLALLTPALSSATKISFTNKCDFQVELYDNSKGDLLSQGQSVQRGLPQGSHGMFRHGKNPQATLAEFSNNGGKVWYDISVIPPGPGFCGSFSDCKAQTKGARGYNIPMAIKPKQNENGSHCRSLICEHEQCPDAYLFPKDDTKTHNCPGNTEFEVVFCPNGKAESNQGNAPQPQNQDNKPAAPAAPIAKPTAVPPLAFRQESGVSDFKPATNGTSFEKATIKSSFTYRGKEAGNMKGFYDMVLDNKRECTSKQRVEVNSPVGPMSEDVTMVFRGPMNIFNIAVFDGSKGGDWQKVSSYDQKEGKVDNMLFMNNKNIDYVRGARSPQGFASASGMEKAETATVFSGELKEATDPNKIGAGPGIQTGAEINIMTEKKCEKDTCKGYFDENGYEGWNGGKKMFVTKVQMPQGAKPNQPAIWMLNSQIVRSNQYGCNCRGMGAKGGCGELDIAEVIETLPSRDKVTTHYYYFDDGNSGADNFAARPTDAPTTYITLIDESGEGTIKILEIGADDFDFSIESVSAAQIQKWVEAKDINLLQK